jgi:hypothetical protein
VVHSFGHEQRREVAGPTRIDEVVRERFELPLRSVWLRGRIVRADGAPVPQAELRLDAAPARFWHDGAVETRDGSLGDRVGAFDFGGAMPTDVATIRGATLRVERAPWCAPTTIALPPLGAGENDLGDLVVAAPSDEVLLASVAVRTGGRDVSATAHAFLQSRGDSRINRVSSIRCLRDDRITFHGPPTSLHLELGCSSPGFLGRRVPVRMGDHVVVELEPAASLTVRVQLPAMPTSLWSARLVDAEGGRHVARQVTDGGFEWRGQQPGPHRLELLVQEDVVHAVSTIDLSPGANAWPPHGALDLRRSARAFRVDAIADDGGDAAEAECHVLRTDRAPPPDVPSPRRDTGSRAWFVPRSYPVDVLVVAPGFVPTILPPPAADTVVRLARATKLRVHTAQGEGVRTIVRVVEDPVHDPWLRALDSGNLHTEDTNPASDEPCAFWCVPGTIVEIVVDCAGAHGAPQRVAIGREPVEVTAR